MKNGFIVAISVTDGGAGYVNPPGISITGGGGSGATGVATLSIGTVTAITVTSAGRGYTSVPAVVIAPPVIPTMAVRMAPMLVVIGEPGSTAQVQYAEPATSSQWMPVMTITLGANPFVWYDLAAHPGQRRYQAISVPPNPSCNPRMATATATVFNGFVIGCTVTDGGEGYLTAPSVSVEGDGSGATAAATISNGVVTHIAVLNAGIGYTSAGVLLSPPPRLTTLTEYRVPRVAVRQMPPTNLVLQSTVALDGTSIWKDLSPFVTGSNELVWFDTTSTGAVSQFYRTAQDTNGPPNPDPLRLTWIRAGSFTMGSPSDEVDRYDSEGPQMAVTISRGFWIGKYEVTQGEYLAVMGSNPSYFKGDLHCPVEKVNWYDATTYCGKLTQQERAAARIATNSVYRLPTEAEWEYACRAWTSTRFSYGDDPGYTNLNDYGWYYANSGQTTHPVGQKFPNPWGLYDMHGSVWEWCQDWYGPYSGGIAVDPQGPVSGIYRVLRGGDWQDFASNCRSATRGSIYPENRHYRFGFRVLLAPGQP